MLFDHQHSTVHGWRLRYRVPRLQLNAVFRDFAAVASAAAAFFAWEGRGHAGNSESFPLGSEAVVAGGAVTATASTAASLWYNPARLAAVAPGGADLAVSAYALRVGGTPELRTGTAALPTRNFSGTTFLAVPSSAAYTMALGGWTIGYGIFVPTVASSQPRSVAELSEGGRVVFDARYQRTETYAGLGVGRQLTSKVSMGASLFLAYFDTERSENIGVFSAGKLLHLSSASHDTEEYGIVAGCGAAYQISSRISLGLSFKSPAFLVHRRDEGVLIRAEREGTDAAQTIASSGRSGGPILSPLRGSVGLAVRLGERSLLAVDLRGRGILNRDGLRISDPQVDARAGIRLSIADGVALGAGVFTDRSAATGREGTGARDILDYYGLSVGVDFGNAYRLHAPRADEPKKLRLTTALGVSYAFGAGSVASLAVGRDANGLPTTSAAWDPAVAHEFLVTFAATIERN